MARSAIIVTIDGWGTNLVGAYGNLLCETPALDDTAAKSIVFDRCLIASSDLIATLQCMVDGVHPSSKNSQTAFASTQDSILSNPHIRSLFITDSLDVSETDWADSFSESLFIAVDSDANVSKENLDESDDQAWEKTAIARFIEEALAELTDRQHDAEGLPEIIWLHLSGLSQIWDAPYEYRLALCDEDDPLPADSTEPIAFELNSTTDPDDLFVAMCVAASQGRIIDHAWSWIDAFIDQLPDRNQTAVVLAGTRGYPLGEHAHVGLLHLGSGGASNREQLQVDDLGEGGPICKTKSLRNPLHAELVHVPLIIQPGVLPIGFRHAGLTQLMTVYHFLRDWFAVPVVENENDTENDPSNDTVKNIHVASITSHAMTSQTIDWTEWSCCNEDSCLIQSGPYYSLCTSQWAALFEPATDTLDRLYLMPDDRWQQNDIRSRAVEIAASMMKLHQQWIDYFTTTNLSDDDVALKKATPIAPNQLKK